MPTMPTIAEAANLDEDEVKLGLMGTDAEREAAFISLYACYHAKLVSYLERKLPGLPSDLVVNAVVDAFRALHEDVVAGTFDFDDALSKFLFKVTWNKGVDELRKITCRSLGNSDFFDIIGESLQGTEVSKRWNHHVQTGKAADISQAFRDFLLTLPPVQKQVAQVMADFIPNPVLEEEICDEIYRRTKKRPTVVQIKSAKREIRKKFKDYLNQ